MGHASKKSFSAFIPRDEVPKKVFQKKSRGRKVEKLFFKEKTADVPSKKSFSDVCSGVWFGVSCCCLETSVGSDARSSSNFEGERLEQNSCNNGCFIGNIVEISKILVPFCVRRRLIGDETGFKAPGWVI